MMVKEIQHAPSGRKLPPQYVVVSFDGCVELESWRAWLAFAERLPDIRLTFFVSGTCFLSDERRMLYEGPGEERGRARIRFGGTPSEMEERARILNAFFLAGHEIASHAVGHFDGAGWSAGKWAAEFDHYDRLVDDYARNNGLGSGQGLAFGSRDIRGFRAPFLSTGPALNPAVAAHGYAYDASSAGRAGAWPVRNKDGLWKFRLASIPLKGCRRTPLSMDYNLFVVQTLESPDIFSDPQRLEDTVVETYMNYFKKNYFGNRAPIHIGHHFTDYAGKTYERALMRFIEAIAGRADVKLCTHMQLVDVLERSQPATEMAGE
jgi:hypothetical protein